jgi:hypothetical protein
MPSKMQLIGIGCPALGRFARMFTSQSTHGAIMAKPNNEQVLGWIEDILLAVAQTLTMCWHHGLRLIRRASPAALLGVALLLALLLTIVPLALMLFLVFMALKLIVGVVVIGRRKRRNEERRP